LKAALVASDSLIVLLLGSRVGTGDSGILASERPDLATILGSKDSSATIIVVSFGKAGAPDDTVRRIRLDPHALSALDRWLGRSGAFAIADRISRTPLGRLLNSLGPVDPGRVFWRSVRGNHEARAAIRSADVVIAGDTAAIKTAWLSVRRGWVMRALYDHRAKSLLVSDR
jgi:hypothetical protein